MKIYDDKGRRLTSEEIKAHKLLRSEKGRAALEKELGCKIVRPADDKADDRPIVALLVPCYQGVPESRMQEAVHNMQIASRECCHFFTVPPVSASVIHWTRNWLIANLIKSQQPWTHVLFLDDDIVPPPDALKKMLAHKKDIVAAVCTRRTDPPIPNIRVYDDKTGEFGELWTWPQDQLIEVGAAGTGMMLISRHALEQVADVWFRCLYEREFYGMSEELAAKIQEARVKHFDAHANAYWFQFLPCKEGSYEMGEDVTFCFKAKRYCDIPTYCDTSVQPGHVGEYVYSISDFLAHQRLAIAQATANQNRKTAKDLPGKISILCPTRGRPENMERLVQSVRDTASEYPEIMFYIDEDDKASIEQACYLVSLDYKRIAYKVGPRITLSQMWNELANIAAGDILMHAGDDLIFKSKGWDTIVKAAFSECEDKILFVHGDDGHFGAQFGTHGFLHRNWIEAVGYFVPPYFSSDYNDTWLNEVANALGRRLYLPFMTEHMHPLWGKGEWDQTHKERLERHKKDKVEELYKNLAPERKKDIQRLRAAMKETVPA